ncbi:B12-binding domain-containing radical SAM protein [Thiococcus pfennigii]|uniref:B12-binding domain-containing radical SAM protein n=1 Tax=Thiococcus pfennigii TaxID=1057 RepID=UPI0019047962|nr:radical SAM protein [Thiococcus pfennigii]MBK1731853.1 hypothetical protein [Thiococcus pfennigii]
MAPFDLAQVDARKDLPGAAADGGRTVLVAPEHFYLFNTLAVPQLTGFLVAQGCPVQQRVLDNEFYSFVAESGTLERSLGEITARRERLAPELVDSLAGSIAAARLPEELGLRAANPGELLDAVLGRGPRVCRLLNAAEALLRTRFLGLSKGRFLLAMARVQLAVDLFVAPCWPSRFGLFGGLTMAGGTERSTVVLEATADAGHNPFLAYYRERVVPSMPGDTHLVGISITHEAQLIPALTLARVIREQRPRVHINLGGATVSTLRATLGAENPLWPLYDSIAVGAGEEAITGLHLALTTGGAGLDQVPNLCWRSADGGIHHNAVASGGELERIATPVFTDPRPNPILTIASSTGCDWARCRFCHFPRIYSDETRYCVRSADAFVRDIATLTERHQPSYFHICDTNLSIEQLEALSDAILRTDLRPRFYSFVRAEKAFTDIDLCRKVRRAGFFALHFGLESGSQEVLNRACKGIRLENVAKLLENFRQTDILANVFMMVGTPGETPEDIDLSVAFVRQHLDKIGGEIAVSRFYLDKYSDIYFHPEAFGIEIRPDPQADLDTDVPFHNPTGYNHEDMESLVDSFYERIGLPRNYGQRFILAMLERFCPDDLSQRIALYGPFLLGSLRRQVARLTEG